MRSPLASHDQHRGIGDRGTSPNPAEGVVTPKRRKRAPYTRTGGARLPDEILAEIWRRHQGGESGKGIAKALGLNQGGVARRIIEMRECGGVPAPKVRKNARVEGAVYRDGRATWHGEQPRVRHTISTDRSLEREAEALRRRDAGEKRADIAKALGVSTWTVGEYYQKARKASGKPSIRLTVEQRSEIERRHDLGQKTGAIGRAIGLDASQVRCYLRRKDMLPPPTIQKPFTAAAHAILRAKMISGEARTVEMLTRWIDHPAPTIRLHLRPLRKELIAAGMLPKCECGDFLFHPVICSPQARKAAQRGLPFVTPAKSKRIRDALVTGKPVAEIAPAVGLSRAQVQHIQTFRLSHRDRERRRISKGRILPASAHRRVSMPAKIIGGRDPMYAEAWSLIPPWIAEDARADIAADICLAVLEKKISPSEIPNYARYFARQFERKFGMDKWSNVKSLDEDLGDGDGYSLSEMIGDEFSVEMIEQLSLGSDW